MYVIVRTQNAGAFAGETAVTDLASALDGEQRIVLINARRLWYWRGAASLSQLATVGSSDPAGCKFPAAVAEILLPEVIEVIAMTDEAVAALDKVPVWQV